MQSALAVALALICLAGVFQLLRKPNYTIVLMLAMFGIEQTLQAYFPILAGGFGWFTNVAIGLLALVAVFNRYVQGGQLTNGYFNAAFWALITLYFYSWLNSFPSPSRDRALTMNASGWPYWIMLIVLAPMLLGSIAEFRRIVIVFMVVGIIFTLFLVLNPAAGYEGSGRLRVDLDAVAGLGHRSNPLALGTMGGMLLVCAVLFRPERSGLLLNMIRGSAFALGLGLAVASGSRGQVMVAVAVSVLLFPMSRKLKNVVQFFAVSTGVVFLLVLIGVVFSLVTSDATIQRWDTDTMALDLENRFGNSLLVFTAYLSSPGLWLTGLGSNAFTSLTPTGDSTPYVHNVYSEIMTEQGLIGTAMLAIMCVAVLKGARRLFLIYRDDPAMRPAVATFLGLTLYGMGLALKQGSFLGSPSIMFFWIVLYAKVSNHEWAMEQAAERAWQEEQLQLEEELAAEEEAMGLEPAG